MVSGQVHAVTTNQAGVFEGLEALVRRYMGSEFLRPIAEHTRLAFEAANEVVKARGCEVVLDSGCGTGKSSVALAGKFPECTVVAVDKSEVRLLKVKERPGNVFAFRAELLDFWRLALAANWRIKFHALYYPNPWPKAAEARRRFHLSPVFPTLLRLAKTHELRTNWKIYAEEFALAADLAGAELGLKATLEEFTPAVPETAFEAKYHGAGQKLYRVWVKEFER